MKPAPVFAPADCSAYRDYRQRSACEKYEPERHVRERHQDHYRRPGSGKPADEGWNPPPLTRAPQYASAPQAARNPHREETK